MLFFKKCKKNITSKDLEIGFSIIIPTYNRAANLKILLDSFLNHHYSNFELIICDDGSIDNTNQIIESYKSRLNIKYFFNPNWGGPARPRNIGINNASHEWICFLDSDDIWHENKLEECNKVISINQDIDIIFHKMKIISNKFNNSQIIGKYIPDNELYNNFKKLLYNGNKIALSSIVVKKKHLTRVGHFSEDKRYIGIEDFDLYLKLSLLNIKFKFLNKCLAFYFISNDNISSDELNQANKIEKLNLEYYLKYPNLDFKKLKSIVRYKKAIYYKKINNNKLSNLYFLYTIKYSKNFSLVIKSIYYILF
jgi:glycosyltransferase involved in cell wall biosynthesis